MSKVLEMEIICRETIKPSSPTPPHLRNYSLSFIDHIVFRNYVPVVFFYPNNLQMPIATKISETSKMLKKSLSEILARYYPFAGRFRDQGSIDCNDEGVLLLITHIKGQNLSEILHNPKKEEFLNPLFPDELQWKDMECSNATILAIQINYFACGGMAISICMSHKVGDALTLFNFVKDWATLTETPKSSEDEEDEQKISAFPVLNGASVFAQGDLPVFPEVPFVKENTVCKRFVFLGSEIDSLRKMVSRSVENPTRVQVVSALLFKRAMSALKTTFGSPGKTTWLRFAVNLRGKMVPPLPEKSVGNMVWFLFVCGASASMENREEELNLNELVRKTKQGLVEFCEKYAKKFGAKDYSFIGECLKEATSVSPDQNYGFMYVVSWCRFPVYEGDFGWGKPIWVTTCGCPVRNSIVLIDTRDGDGIEALVNMDAQDMAAFQRDAELLQQASCIL